MNVKMCDKEGYKCDSKAATRVGGDIKVGSSALGWYHQRHTVPALMTTSFNPMIRWCVVMLDLTFLQWCHRCIPSHTFSAEYHFVYGPMPRLGVRLRERRGIFIHATCGKSNTQRLKEPSD